MASARRMWSSYLNWSYLVITIRSPLCSECYCCRSARCSVMCRRRKLEAPISAMSSIFMPRSGFVASAVSGSLGIVGSLSGSSLRAWLYIVELKNTWKRPTSFLSMLRFIGTMPMSIRLILVMSSLLDWFFVIISVMRRIISGLRQGRVPWILAYSLIDWIGKLSMSNFISDFIVTVCNFERMSSSTYWRSALSDESVRWLVTRAN